MQTSNQELREKASKLVDKMFHVVRELLEAKGLKVEGLAVWPKHYENAEEIIAEFMIPLSEPQRLYYEGAYEECADSPNPEKCVNALKADFRLEKCDIEVFKYSGRNVKAFTMTVEGEFGGEYYYCYPAMRFKISRVLYPYMIDDLMSDDAKLKEFVLRNVVDPAMQILDIFKLLQNVG